MDFAFDDRTQDLRERLLAFMDEHVYPAEPVFGEQVEAAQAGKAPLPHRGTEQNTQDQQGPQAPPNQNKKISKTRTTRAHKKK